MGRPRSAARLPVTSPDPAHRSPCCQRRPEPGDILRRCLDLGECLAVSTAARSAGVAVEKLAHFYGRDFIELLMVDPAHRRRGIGRDLLRAAHAAAGTEQVFTSTNTSNQPMRSLLQAEGWSFSGQLDGLDEGDPELVFYKTSSTFGSSM